MCVGKNSELTTLISVQTWAPILIKELANSYNKDAPALSKLQKGQQRGKGEEKHLFVFFKGHWLQVVFSLYSPCTRAESHDHTQLQRAVGSVVSSQVAMCQRKPREY